MQMLTLEGIVFCRYADGHRIFAATEQEAYRHLVSLTRHLFTHEGRRCGNRRPSRQSKDSFVPRIFLAEDSTELSPEDREARFT